MRDFKRSALIVLIGAGISLVASSRTWVSVSVSDEALPLTDMSFTGRELVSTAYALALCVVVLVLGMALAKNFIRRALAALSLGIAVLAIVELSRFLGNTSPAINELVAASLGRELVQSAVSLSAWPYLSIIGLTLSIVGNAIVAVSPGKGAGLSTKYERSEKVDKSGKDADVNPWAALDAGIDPTL